MRYLLQQYRGAVGLYNIDVALFLKQSNGYIIIYKCVKLFPGGPSALLINIIQLMKWEDLGGLYCMLKTGVFILPRLI